LRYEVEMFFKVGERVSPNAWATPESRAVLESFIVHLRNLVDFFYPSLNLKETDVIAADYFDDRCAWQRLRPASSDVHDLLTARARAHKQLVHLTTDRETGDPSWDIKRLLFKMFELVTEFVSEASDQLLDPSVEAAIPVLDRLLTHEAVVASTASGPYVLMSGAASPRPDVRFGDECEEDE
jgi:hypothetical protein